ncbi:sodium-dependent transporter [Desulfitobacterium metallireducens]|uniref:Transporter n=1 Tax=Desulfitobacterium metallireducens DSM 15288 TaxID=871968 RepID=W0EBH0_9FIRM|nr:sodium-dependent transporter [Desulfitobacterium metallireducens]AHF06559.1 Na+-dependent transporter [Desulfitobacterium metallireducens DSM 15288]
MQETQHDKLQREGFSSSLGVIAATLGSAVGLGNIWKFPYVTGQNGGAAFILIYLIATLLISMPVMLSELMIGRKTNANAVGALRKLAPQEPWFLLGVSGVLSAFLIMAFYTDVAGWVFSYIFKAAVGTIHSTSPEQTYAVFQGLVSGVGEPLFWQIFVLVVTGTIIMSGVAKGIERVTKILMPVLFVLLFIVDIRSLMLPGASEGLKFLFDPDFSKISFSVVLAALGLAFFKLSVGMGTMTTYGSYIGKEEDLPRIALKVMLSDTLVSIMAGIAIFPAVFAFGFKPNDGPSLLFITIPMVFSSMPFGRPFMVLFFILVAVAATGAMLSLLEVPVAYLVEEHKLTRRVATLGTISAVALVGSTATLSTSLLSDVMFFGKNMFDFYDFLTSNILLPLGGIFFALFVGWRWGYQRMFTEFSNDRHLKNEGFAKIYFFLVKYVAPIAIMLVLLAGLGFLKLK